MKIVPLEIRIIRIKTQIDTEVGGKITMVGKEVAMGVDIIK